MGDYMESINAAVYIQENGIIRLHDSGLCIGRLSDSVSYQELKHSIKTISKAELKVLTAALDTHRKRLMQHEMTAKYLEGKKFHMGDYIIKKGTTHFDGVFGTGDGNIGKIVGYDMAYNYYRVYYNEGNTFIGVRENDMELYEGEIPEHLQVYDPTDFKSLIVNL